MHLFAQHPVTGEIGVTVLSASEMLLYLNVLLTYVGARFQAQFLLQKGIRTAPRLV